MPLIKAGLQAELAGIFGATNPSGAITGQKVASAIGNYWAMGQSSFAGMAVTVAAVSAMTPLLASAYEGSKPQAAAIDLISTAIDTGMLALILSGGKHGVGGISSTMVATLKDGVKDALDEPPSGLIHATKLAGAIDDYSKQAMVWGSGMPPDFAPPTGTLS